MVSSPTLAPGRAVPPSPKDTVPAIVPVPPKAPPEWTLTVVSARLPATLTVPPCTAVGPVYVLTALSVSVPAPVLLKPPPAPLTTAAIVMSPLPPMVLSVPVRVSEERTAIGLAPLPVGPTTVIAGAEV